MLTPETTAKTEGPILGSSSILGNNDSLLNNNMSLISKKNNILNQPKIKKLSNYISLDLKKIFVDKNKSALQDYEKFLKITKRNNTISKNHKNNFIEHYYKSPFKENPKLIISSYNTKIFGNNDELMNKKYKVDIIGVDEGYIRLPTFQNNEFSRLLKEQDNFDGDKNIKEELTMPKIKEKNNKRKSYIKLKNAYNNKTFNITYDLIRKKREKKNKKIMSHLSRGEEFLSNIGMTQNENEILNEKKNIYEKLKENFEAQNNFKYEIKKLENWDFEHCQKERLKKFVSNENMSNILKKPENSQMKWYLEIKNDKKQLKLMCRNKHLKEFFSRIEKEQKAIFLQSFSVNKKVFNFEIFKNEKNEIQNEKKEEENLKKIEFYKDVMKEKIKIEEMFHSELTNCAEQVHITRIRKKEAMIELYEITKEINEVNKEEQNVKKNNERNMNRMKEYTDVLNILTKIAAEKNLNKNKENKGVKKNNYKSPKKQNKILNAIKTEVINKEHRNIAMRRRSIIQMSTNFSLEEKNESLYKFNLDKLDLTAFHEKADLFQLQSDLIAQKNALEEKYNKEMKKIIEKKTVLELKFKEKKIEIKNITAYSKKAKSNLDLRIQTLSGYYYQILKTGIDVRRNGLTWVIVKLMELRAYVDKHYLPLFLDDEQMSYILRVGVKIHELNELIKLFQILKEKQKILRDKHLNEELKKEKEIQSTQFKSLVKENKKKIGNNYTKYIEDIQIKYENVINICLNENREESNINKIKNELKERILKSKYDDELELLNEPELYFIPGTLAASFVQDKRFRQYFDDVYYLNDEINKRKRDILEEKEKEMKLFRKKYDLDDNSKKIKDKLDGKNTNSVKNEQIYAALFGNGVSF